MKNVLKVAWVAALALWALPAGAQEAHKFNAKALEAKYAVPVYPTKGKVENNEVIEATDEFSKAESATYMVKSDAKKVVDFYTKAMGDAKHETTDVGADKWYFKKDDATDKRLKHKVIVQRGKGAKLVQITLWQRKYESAADADE
jgi:hypothetical protein